MTKKFLKSLDNTGVFYTKTEAKWLWLDNQIADLQSQPDSNRDNVLLESLKADRDKIKPNMNTIVDLCEKL